MVEIVPLTPKSNKVADFRRSLWSKLCLFYPSSWFEIARLSLSFMVQNRASLAPSRFEVVSVIIKSCNQLKITFLEAQDITDLGSLKEATKIFIPGGSSLYSARTIKIKEDEGFRTYYFHEFSRDEQHVALVAAVSGGLVVVAGATAPEFKWDDDCVKLRSSALSLTLL
ncbi:hypothetical protein BVRB_3g061440 [Beta vulgaris subsp. vulgaris]|nr:hypothetical protein BVRB_3g061440 [Beta vulgaris subsp. vulgaris]